VRLISRSSKYFLIGFLSLVEASEGSSHSDGTASAKSVTICNIIDILFYSLYVISLTFNIDKYILKSKAFFVD